ncbi:LysE family transporter [Neorhizobium galegae]|uniref:LysE family translocator n=1 Tax=Neorhizobium galegae TaxID=399 RepID=UPI002101269A|nr:LysE family transporter [Neorhizobium galegae]MCQ1574159.1 LysE family transporter [Neorhizobium galegae]MCQ1837539.1 LysE family transporter [Neorhizobium galegae]UIY31739.1 LysE family transporter [Neorhizobium galegae]
MIITPLLASLALPYALVLMSPGPNLFVVLRVAVEPSWYRSLSIAAGIASGATVACYLAAIGTSTLGTFDDLNLWASLLLSSILLYSAWRLIRHPARRQGSQSLSPETFHVRLFGLGLATALSNPLSIPFFASFYLAEPGFRTASGNAVVCAVIFLMAMLWFTAVGVLVSVSSIRSTEAKWCQKARYILAIAMGTFALKLLFETSV